LAAKLNIQKLEDWYKVQRKILLQEGGSFVNTYYSGSMIKGNTIDLFILKNKTALQAVYPELQWQSSGSYWKHISNQKLFFDQLAIKLNIQQPEDWYRVSKATILREGGQFIVNYYSSSPIKGTSSIASILS
jgi:hypothetical protein